VLDLLAQFFFYYQQKEIRVCQTIFPLLDAMKLGDGKDLAIMSSLT
jgi:hypothetical protein